MRSVVFCLVFWSVNVIALVPIPLEPQRPCFTHFGECLRYCPGERIPDLEGVESSCITNSNGYQFCKFYHCPPTKCGRRRRKDMYGKCYFCPGTCIDGGQIHINGQAFHSFDFVNSCFCGQGNSKHCTKHPVDQYSYCNHARPESEIRKTAVVVIDKPRPPPPQPNIVAVIEPPKQPPPPPQVIAVVTPPTPPPPPPPPPPKFVAFVPPPTQPPPPPPAVAFVQPPTNPPTPPNVAYVQAPTTQTPAQAVYVPAPTNPPQNHNVAFVPPPPQENRTPKVVPHPNYSAKSPKSNLQQRSNNNPNLYRNSHSNPDPYHNQNPYPSNYNNPPNNYNNPPNNYNNPPNNYNNPHHYQRNHNNSPYPNNRQFGGYINPFFGQMPWGMNSFNNFNKEVEL